MPTSPPAPPSAWAPAGRMLRRWWRGESRVTVFNTLAAVSLALAFSGDVVRYTLGWGWYAGIVGFLMAFGVVLFVRRRPPLRFSHLPLPLLMFLSWCTLSLVWSEYRPETLLGLAAQIGTTFTALVFAVTLTRLEFVRVLGSTMRALVGGSLIFELAVAIWAPGGLVPPAYWRPGVLESLLGPNADFDDIPPNLYWSHADLFHENAIQGLPGNRNLLAMIALIALVITIAQFWDRDITWLRFLLGLAITLIALWRTDSATVYVAIVFVTLGAAMVAIGRRLERRWRWALYAAVGVCMIAGAVLVVRFNDVVFAAMDRSPDISGRGTIWRSVIAFGSESPVLGHGWISYWAPWLPQFAKLGEVNGTAYHQAHNAYLDVWMQVGTVGLICFVGVTFTALVRTWWIAIDRPDTPLIERASGAGRTHLAVSTAVPFLLMVALVVQSMTESRLIIEGGWLLLSYFSIYAKLRIQDPSILPRRTLATHTGPITVIVNRERDR